MFIRKQIKNKVTYYSLVYSYRQNGKVKQTTQGLGSPPSLLKIKLPEEMKEKLYRTYPELAVDYERFKRKKEEKTSTGTNKILNHIAILAIALDRTPFDEVSPMEKRIVEEQVQYLQERLNDYLVQEARVLQELERMKLSVKLI